MRARDFPFVTAAIIGANVLVFLIEARLPQPVLEGFFWLLGVVPARFIASPSLWEWSTLLTSQFVHAGLLHLASNVLALYIFGDNVEDRLGHLRYFLFYLVCGVGAALAQVAIVPHSTVPAVGASGAISGVMAAYLILFPTARVITLVPIFFIPWFIDIPAVLWIGGWFLAQLLNGVLLLAANVEPIGGVGWWAHVGGFLAGLVLVWPLRRSAPRYYLDQYWPW